jgi:hypothetical protein
VGDGPFRIPGGEPPSFRREPPPRWDLQYQGRAILVHQVRQTYSKGLAPVEGSIVSGPFRPGGNEPSFRGNSDDDPVLLGLLRRRY